MSVSLAELLPVSVSYVPAGAVIVAVLVMSPLAVPLTVALMV